MTGGVTRIRVPTVLHRCTCNVTAYTRTRGNTQSCRSLTEVTMRDPAEPWTVYPPKRENLLAMLHATQKAHRSTSHIPTEELAAIAEYLGIPLAEIEGVTSFYHAFAREPRGRHVIRLCDSLSCRVRGSLDVYRHIKSRLGIPRGETSNDGRYSLEIVNCLGSCDTAPNVMIDDTLLTEVTPESFDTALKEIEAVEAQEVRS